MGNICVEQGKYAKALKMYRMALDQISDVHKGMRLKILQNIGTVFVKMGRYSDAITSFEHIMEERADFKTGNGVHCSFFVGACISHLWNHSSTEFDAVLLCHKWFRKDEEVLPPNATDKHWHWWRSLLSHHGKQNTSSTVLGHLTFDIETWTSCMVYGFACCRWEHNMSKVRVLCQFRVSKIVQTWSIPVWSLDDHGKEKKNRCNFVKYELSRIYYWVVYKSVCQLLNTTYTLRTLDRYISLWCLHMTRCSSCFSIVHKFCPEH